MSYITAKEQERFLSVISPYAKVYWLVEEGYETKRDFAEDIVANIPDYFDRIKFISFLSNLIPEASTLPLI